MCFYFPAPLAVALFRSLPGGLSRRQIGCLPQPGTDDRQWLLKRTRSGPHRRESGTGRRGQIAQREMAVKTGEHERTDVQLQDEFARGVLCAVLGWRRLFLF